YFGQNAAAASRRKVQRVVEAYGNSLKLCSDILLYAAFFFRDPEYDPQAVEKRLRKPGAAEILRQVAQILASFEPFEAKPLEERLHAFCQERGLKPGDLNHILRVATTGVTIGPGMFDCLAILGREETLRRMERALQVVAASP